MKSKKKVFLFLYLFLIFCSCTDYGSIKNQHQKEYKNKCTLQLIKKVEIPIDDETSCGTEYMQYIDNKYLPHALSILNVYNNSIYFFDYETYDFINKIIYEKEGSNGVGNIQGYEFIDKEDILVYNYQIQTLYMTNNKGEVKWKKNLDLYSVQSLDLLPAFPQLQTNNPLKSIDETIIMNGCMGAETTLETLTNSPVTTIYDHKNDTILFANNYPEQYIKYNFGGGYFRMPYFDLNKKEKSLIISFPQDHYLYVYSLTDKTQKKYYAGSRLINKIDAYPQKKEENTEINMDMSREWFRSTPSYRNVHYDPYRNLYYRIARLPYEERLSKFNYNTHPFILIVLDGQFNYLGESLLPDDVDLRISNSFVSKEGFNIQAMTENDDLMTFYQFKVQIEE